MFQNHAVEREFKINGYLFLCNLAYFRRRTVIVDKYEDVSRAEIVTDVSEITLNIPQTFPIFKLINMKKYCT